MNMNIFSANTIHLTGIKGVAMTSLAQCLVDMGKKVTGSDVSEDFVTKRILKKLDIPIFPIQLKENATPQFVSRANPPHNPQPTTHNIIPDLLIYTAAHGGPYNPEVIWAQKQGIPTLSHAEAMSQLFNQKKGIAVCGVGGKSTTSAMIAWILDRLGKRPSFCVGVGEIIGMGETGKWIKDSEYFIAEADEYVTDPSAPDRGEEITPRFTYMKPQIIVCTNLKHDHPDVYQDFTKTKHAFGQFFESVKENGILIVNGDNSELLDLAHQVVAKKNIQLIAVGTKANSDFIIKDYLGNFESDKLHQVSLQIPGIFNVFNAVMAIATCRALGISIEKSIDALKSFQSTQRRFEFKGENKGVKYYDDYAHHPSEVQGVIQALSEKFPDRRKVIAFQPHTFSRTKQLFTDFIESFSQAKELLLLDIFSSAREEFDPTISSDDLVNAVKSKFPKINIVNLHSIEELAKFCKNSLNEGDVCLTIGAGDIYKVHEELI